MAREIKPYDGMNAYAEPAAASVQTVDLGKLMVAIRRQRLVIVLPAVVLGMLGLIYASAKPETYTAYSNLILDSNVNRSVQQAGGIDTASLPAEQIENARVVLESEKLADDVLTRTGLDKNVSFMNPPRSAFTSAIGKGISTVFYPVSWLRHQVMELVATPKEQPQIAQAEPSDTSTIIDPLRRLAAMQLQAGVRVARIGQSSVVGVGFISHDPVIASQVANAYADAYVQDILTANANAVGQTNTWMRTRLDELQTQAQKAASAAERFAAENQLVELSSGGLLTEQALNELNSSLTSVMTEAARAKAVLDTYDQAVAGGVDGLTSSNSSLTIGGVISDELRARLASYNDVQARLQRLLTVVGPRDPQVSGLRRTLASTAERLFVELQSQRAEAQSALNVANARVKALQESVADASQKNSAQAVNLVRLRALQEKAATLSALYQQTLTRSQEIEQQQSFPVANVRILSYAQPPELPSGPAVMRTALAAALLGMFIGMVTAALRERRERALRTALDVTERSGLRFLGHLPVLPQVRPPRVTNTPAPVTSNQPASAQTLPVLARAHPPVIHVPVPALSFPDSVYAETLRHVRLAADATEHVKPVLGVSSFLPYDGCASVAFNLATQLGLGQGTVLLVDADSRNPALSRLLGIEKKQGLTDAMAGRGEWQDMLVAVAGTNLLVLPCGTEQGGPADDAQTAQLISAIATEAGGKEFSRVIINVPPLYPVAQGRAILRGLPQFVIVAEWGETPRAMAETALAEDPTLEARCLGVIYDRVNLRKLRAFLMPGEVENYIGKSKI